MQQWGHIDIRSLRELNTSLKALIKALEEYLQTINTTPIIEDLRKIFKPSKSIDSNLVLNFNYTDTVEKYINDIQPEHLRNTSNSTIFMGKLEMFLIPWYLDLEMNLTKIIIL